MGLPTVSNFLCCLTLETGGLIIGWTTAILSGIGLILVTFALIGGIALLDALVITFAIILAIYYIIVLYAAVMLIKATNSRNPSQMKLFLILMAVGVVLSFLNILTIGWSGIAAALIYALIYGYFFLCIYSLYQLLKGG